MTHILDLVPDIWHHHILPELDALALLALHCACRALGELVATRGPRLMNTDVLIQAAAFGNMEIPAWLHRVFRVPIPMPRDAWSGLFGYLQRTDRPFDEAFFLAVIGPLDKLPAWDRRDLLYQFALPAGRGALKAVALLLDEQRSVNQIPAITLRFDPPWHLYHWADANVFHTLWRRWHEFFQAEAVRASLITLMHRAINAAEDIRDVNPFLQRIAESESPAQAEHLLLRLLREYTRFGYLSIKDGSDKYHLAAYFWTWIAQHHAAAMEDAFALDYLDKDARVAFHQFLLQHARDASESSL